jgi:VWFA-related protein
MRRTWVRSGPLATSAAFLVALPILGQQRAPAAKPVTEAVQVHVVNVEVFATGKDGQPVLDLKPEEFELREDGRPVSLSNFLAPAGNRFAAAAAAAEAPLALPAAGGSEESQRTLVVFVDSLNLRVVGRNLVLDRLEDFLGERLRDGWRVLVVEFDRSLHQLTPLTGDPEQVASAVEALRTRTAEGTMTAVLKQKIVRDMGRGSAIESPDPAASVDAGELARQELLREIETFAEEQFMLNTSLLEALGRFVDGLAGLPGRKAVLYVSDGVPARVADELFREYQARFPGRSELIDTMSRFSLSTSLQEVTRRANASRITFYTINARPDIGLEHGMADVGGAPNETPLETIEAMSRDESLVEFAAGTGGLPLYNTSSLADGLQKMADDLESAYLLGYAPDHFGDGKFHKLSVRVRRAGVSVRCRQGYLDKSPEQRQADRTTGALLAGGNDNPLGARVELGNPERQGKNKILVPLTVFVRAGTLTLLEAGGNHEGKVSVAIAVAKFNGKPSQVHRQTFPVKVPSAHVEGFRGIEASFAFQLLIQAGDRDVSVTVRDEVSGIESVVVTDLTVEPEKR